MAQKNRNDLVTPLPQGWAIYLRTSSQYAQSPGRSQDMQRQSIDLMINASRLPALQEYVDVVSGKTINRKNFQRMLKDAEQRKFSHLIVSHPDRFGRNAGEALVTLDRLHELGITVRVATIPEVDDVSSRRGRLHITIMFAIAEHESAMHGERIKMVQYESKEIGDWSWKAPDGYLNLKEAIPNHMTEQREYFGKQRSYIALDPKQSPVWRCAWDLLLYENLNLKEICEQLHARGYRLRSGTPFVKVLENGKRRHNCSALSKMFHKPFYAALLYYKDQSGNQVVRPANWESIVSLEEFNKGLEILAKRDKEKNHRPSNYYLLQGLVYLQGADGSLVKLTCSTSNKYRERGGVVSHYCDHNHSPFFICQKVDEQIVQWLHSIEIDTQLLPHVQRVFREEIESRLKKVGPDELTELRSALDKIDRERERVTRQFAMGNIGDDLFAKLVREWIDQRNQILQIIDSQRSNVKRFIDDIEAALQLLTVIGKLYEKLDPLQRRNLLRNLLKQVILDEQGMIIDVILHKPFAHIRNRLDHSNVGESRGNNRKNNQPKDVFSESGSTRVSCGGPKSIESEPSTPLDFDDPLRFVELTAYPQRSALEPLLAID